MWNSYSRESNNKVPVLYGICGPTASGKTALAVQAAQRLGAEIVSADSMQVYRGMDILSAVPSAEETRGVRHHLISFVPCEERYNASRYREDAMKSVGDIHTRGALPLLCGGTGLYIDALTRGIRMAEEADLSYREELKKIASEPGGEFRLHDMLSSLDPDSARKYPPGDVRRVIRSLEIIRATGKPRGEAEKEDREREEDFRCRLFALKWDRAVLYRRIDKRVDNMLCRGLTDEVKRLMKADIQVQETAAQAIGFKEIRLALEGTISMDEAVELVKRNTRRLAKRQETWFKRDERVQWFETDGSNINDICDRIVHTIQEEMHDS